MYHAGTKEFFEVYTKRAAVEAKVPTPLGYYLAPYGYATGQMIEVAVRTPSRSTRRASRSIAGGRTQDHRRAVTSPRMARKRHGAGAVPRGGRQGHRTIPQARQAGDPVPRQTEDRRAPSVPSRRPGSRPRGCSGAAPRGDLTCFRWTCCLAQWCLGCCSAALLSVSVGLSVSFGLLDVPHVAHPASLVLASYGVYQLNESYDIDPLLAGLAITPLLFLFGLLTYRIYYETFERRGRAMPRARHRVFLRRRLHHRGADRPPLRRRPALGDGELYRKVLAVRRVSGSDPGNWWVRGGAGAEAVYCWRMFSNSHGPRDPRGAQDEEALRLMGANPSHQAVAFGIASGACVR